MTASYSTTSVILPKNEEGAQIIDDDYSELDGAPVGLQQQPPEGDADQVAEMMAKFVQQRLSTVNDDQSEIMRTPQIQYDMSSDGSSVQDVKVMKANGIQSKAYISVHDMGNIKEEDEDSMDGDIDDLNRRVQMADGSNKKIHSSAQHIGLSNTLGLDIDVKKDKKKHSGGLDNIAEIDQKSNDVVENFDHTDLNRRIEDKNKLIQE